MNCSFCNKDIELGTETIFVSKKGKAFYFCSKKCEKNLLKLKRKPRKVRWTEEYRKEKAIRLKGIPKEEKAREKPEKKAAEKPKPEEKPAEKKAKKEKPKEEKKVEKKTKAEESKKKKGKE